MGSGLGTAMGGGESRSAFGMPLPLLTMLTAVSLVVTLTSGTES